MDFSTEVEEAKTHLNEAIQIQLAGPNAASREVKAAIVTQQIERLIDAKIHEAFQFGSTRTIDVLKGGE